MLLGSSWDCKWQWKLKPIKILQWIPSSGPNSPTAKSLTDFTLSHFPYDVKSLPKYISLSTYNISLLPYGFCIGPQFFFISRFD